MRFFLCFVFLIFFFLTPKFLFSETFFGEVSFVPDGDTIHLKKNFKKFKIRLYGIDCPEIKQLGGVSAKRRVKELIFKKKVKVESKGYDRYGRVIGKVFIEGNDFSVNGYGLIGDIQNGSFTIKKEVKAFLNKKIK